MVRRSAVAFVMLALFSSATARAAEVKHFKIREEAALAIFQGTDPTGCIQTDVFVAASLGAAREDGTTSPPQRLAAVVVTRFDTCRGLQLMAATGDAQTVDLRVDPNLQTATLRTVVPVYDFETDRFFDVSVDLTWEAIGQQIVDATTNTIQDPPFTIRTQFQGRIRPARVVGVVSEGITNFTTNPSTEGQIQVTKLGEVTISKAD